MFVQSSLLWLAIASLPNGGTPKAPAYDGPYQLRGQVVDVFEDGRVLLSIGKEDGARKGLTGTLWRGDPSPAGFGVEFLEVGGKHSVVRAGLWLFGAGYRNPLPFPFALARKIEPLTENDSVVWYSSEPLPVREIPRPPGYFLPGGAIMDLTTPNGAKMLPRVK